MERVSNEYPYWQLKIQRKKAKLSGVIPDMLLNWLFLMGIRGAVKVRVFKTSGVKCSGIYRFNTVVLIHPQLKINHTTLVHECFHLAFRHDKDKVLKWVFSKRFFKLADTLTKIKDIVGVYNFTCWVKYYRKHYKVNSKKLLQLMLEESLANQFETYFDYLFCQVK